ncbi:MAG: hypothetical protein QG577_856, partial [Thermodesulfobacteriota bacterium]|nr:hypothetical protein [Thermodesulfobacteriota bacterium]
MGSIIKKRSSSPRSEVIGSHGARPG